MTVLIHCPVEECEKTYKTEAGRDDHIKAKHPDYKPATPPEKNDKPNAPENPPGDTGPREQSDVEAELRARVAELEAELEKPAGKRLLSKPVKPITDEELEPLVQKAAKLLWDRNRKIEDAGRRSHEGRHDEADALVAEAEKLELEAAPLCAKVAGVPIGELAFKVKRGKGGNKTKYGYGVNVRRGCLRVVLRDGRRLKIDVADLSRAKWDYVHDNEPDLRRRTSVTPGAWQGRKTVPALR